MYHEEGVPLDWLIAALLRLSAHLRGKRPPQVDSFHSLLWLSLRFSAPLLSTAPTLLATPLAVLHRTRVVHHPSAVLHRPRTIRRSRHTRRLSFHQHRHGARPNHPAAAAKLVSAAHHSRSQTLRVYKPAVP